jgi:hypothetical protein
MPTILYLHGLPPEHIEGLNQYRRIALVAVDPEKQAKMDLPQNSPSTATAARTRQTWQLGGRAN